jgi:uncharacterized protein YukE
MLVGLVDFYDGAKVYGWAIDQDDLTKVLDISVQSGGAQIAGAPAGIFRPDLAEAGFGDGKHAFEIVLPHWVRSIRQLTFVAKASDEKTTTLKIETEIDRLLAEAIAQYGGDVEKRFSRVRSELSAQEAAFSDIYSKIDEITKSTSQTFMDLKKIIEDNDIFIVRLDERLSKIENALAQKKRKRFLGIF